MQNLMAVLVLVLAGVIIWRSWSTIQARHAPVMAVRGRGKRENEAFEAPVMPASTPWFTPPANPVLELKAARVRSEPAALGPVAQIARRGGWNAEDDAELLRLLGEAMPPEDIADRLGRSEKAVQLRIPLLRLRQRQAEQAAGASEAR
jgi:hypothetical protein